MRKFQHDISDDFAAGKIFRSGVSTSLSYMCKRIHKIEFRDYQWYKNFSSSFGEVLSAARLNRVSEKIMLVNLTAFYSGSSQIDL